MTTATDQPGTDPGNPFEITDEELRTRALLALRQGRFDLAEKLLLGKDVDQAALVESLRIYQAELEIQNEELQRSHHRTQTALNRFMAFFDSLPVAELVVDGQGLVKEANEEARRLFDLRDTVYHQYFFIRLIEASDRGSAVHALAHLRPEEPIDLHELKFRDNTDEVFIGDLHMAALPTDEDEGRRVLCAVVDRTEAVLQREALRESRERYRVIAELKRSREQLHFLAQHDALTGLPNRSLFRQRLEEAIPRTIRRGGETALLFLDLDRFKIVNDTLGHPVGDLLLK